MFHTIHHANLKKLHCDSQETNPCCIENDTETVNCRLLFPVSMGLILAFPEVFTSSQKFKTRVHTLLFITMTLRLCSTT